MQFLRVCLAVAVVSSAAPGPALAQIGPANDSCGGAIGPLAIPSSTLGATIGTTPDPGLPDCGDPNTAPGVWYRVIGNGNRITATTCNAPGAGGAASYDSRLSIFCGPCSALVCVAENDDNCVGGSNQFASTVSWCSQPGIEYRILVHGFASTDFGTFTLRLTQDGLPCAAEVVCVEIGACCMPDDTCVDGVQEAVCTAQGGEFQGHQSQCGEPHYPVESCASPFEDISAAGTVASNASNLDDSGDVVPIGFTFNFFAEDHDSIMVRSNGYLTFGGGAIDDFISVPPPSAGEPNDLIAPYWDDWSPDQAGTVYYQTLGMPPNRRFIAQWTGVERFDGAVGELATFQAVLFEGTNCIEFRYGTDLFVALPVVGVENQDGTVGTNVRLAEAAPGGCVRLCPTGPISCAPPGACCLPDGSCVPATQPGGADCTAQGGVYQGDDTDCGSSSCPQPGACCLDDGSCVVAGEVGGADCTAAGGAYQGDDTDCGSATCPHPGACCMNDGSCTLSTEVGGGDCTAAGGTYQGDNTDCDSVSCALPGACCMGDGSCALAAELGGADCTAAGGAYQGNGTTCATANCAQPGACCMDDGSCVQGAVLGGADCALDGGDYQGDDTECATANCPQPPGQTGACCAPDGACSLVTEAACLASGGAYAGAGVSCFAADCPKAGACCLPDGSCMRLDEAGGADCIAMGGVYGGDDTNCLTVDCPRPGACCMADGSCRRAETLGGADCTAAGGSYDGDGTDCHPNPCPRPDNPDPNPEPEPEPEPDDNCTSGLLPMLLPLMLFGWSRLRRTRGRVRMDRFHSF